MVLFEEDYLSKLLTDFHSPPSYSISVGLHALIVWEVKQGKPCMSQSYTATLPPRDSPQLSVNRAPRLQRHFRTGPYVLREPTLRSGRRARTKVRSRVLARCLVLEPRKLDGFGAAGILKSHRRLQIFQ